MRRTRVKVCCIASLEEAALAVAHGADALGLVGPMPSGPGIIDAETAAAIAAWAPPMVAPVLLTKATEAAQIVAHVQACGAQTVQLVDMSSPADCAVVRAALPWVRILQVLHVTGEGVEAEALRMAPHVHGLLLDSGDPDGAVPTYGGTGKIHDWSISRRIVDQVSVPVFLAGGLRPGNVQAALNAVRPFGVDLCTGLRAGGRLQVDKLEAFMAAVRAYDAGR